MNLPTERNVETPIPKEVMHFLYGTEQEIQDRFGNGRASEALVLGDDGWLVWIVKETYPHSAYANYMGKVAVKS